MEPACYHSTAVVDNKGAVVVVVYPNPVADLLYIEVPDGISEGGVISLTDVTGKEVRNQRMTANTGWLDMNNLPAGVYIFRYTNNLVNQTIKINKL
jgi:hypothetical protein